MLCSHLCRNTEAHSPSSTPLDGALTVQICQLYLVCCLGAVRAQQVMMSYYCTPHTRTRAAYTHIHTQTNMYTLHLHTCTLSPAATNNLPWYRDMTPRRLSNGWQRTFTVCSCLCICHLCICVYVCMCHLCVCVTCVYVSPVCV